MFHFSLIWSGVKSSGHRLSRCVRVLCSYPGCVGIWARKQHYTALTFGGKSHGRAELGTTGETWYPS